MLVRCDADGKLYLHDLVRTKKETSKPPEQWLYGSKLRFFQIHMLQEERSPVKKKNSYKISVDQVREWLS